MRATAVAPRQDDVRRADSSDWSVQLEGGHHGQDIRTAVADTSRTRHRLRRAFPTRGARWREGSRGVVAEIESTGSRRHGLLRRGQPLGLRPGRGDAYDASRLDHGARGCLRSPCTWRLASSQVFICLTAFGCRQMSPAATERRKLRASRGRGGADRALHTCACGQTASVTCRAPTSCATEHRITSISPATLSATMMSTPPPPRSAAGPHLVVARTSVTSRWPAAPKPAVAEFQRHGGMCPITPLFLHAAPHG